MKEYQLIALNPTGNSLAQPFENDSFYGQFNGAIEAKN